MRFTSNWLHLRQARDGNKAAQVASSAVEKEADLHADIIALCKSRGWLFFHGAMSAKTRRTEGEPDFLIFPGDGRVMLVECKTAKGKQSPAQLAVAAHAEKMGVPVHVVRSIGEFIEATEL